MVWLCNLVRAGMRKILRLLCRKNNRKWILLVLGISVIALLFLTVESWILPDRFTVNRYDSAVVKPGFIIKSPFSFSEPQAIKPVRELLEMHWMKDLTDILSKRSSKQVIFLIVEKEYFATLLNWLVAFEMSTKNSKLDDILIFSLDERVCNILKDKAELSTVCLHFDQIIRHYNILYRTKYLATWDIIIVRMALVRLLNHWGYNVLVIDLDAIVLKDPFPLLDKYPDADIITSFSITSLRPNIRGICFGFLLLKSTDKVGKLLLINVEPQRKQLLHVIDLIIPVVITMITNFVVSIIIYCKYSLET